MPWSPNNNTLITIENDNQNRSAALIIWDVQRCEPTGKIKNNDGVLTTVSWSNDGSKIAAGDKNCLTIWNAKNKEIVQERNLPGTIEEVLWSPDGTRLACLCHKEDGNYTLKIVDFTKNRLIDIPQATFWRFKFCWNHDGTMLAVAMSSKITRYTKDGALIAKHDLAPSCKPSVAWSHDGAAIAAGSDFGKNHYKCNYR